MNYLVKARARLDLKNHSRHISRDNLPAADRLLDAAEQTFKLIAGNPGIGSQRSFRKLAGVRSRAVTGFRNHLVFYQTAGPDGCDCARPSWYEGSAEVLFQAEGMRPRLPATVCALKLKLLTRDALRRLFPDS